MENKRFKFDNKSQLARRVGGDTRDLIFDFASGDSRFVDKRSSRCSSDELIFRVAKSLVSEECPLHTQAVGNCCQLSKDDNFNRNLKRIALHSTRRNEKDLLHGVFEWARNKLNVKNEKGGDIVTHSLDLEEFIDIDEKHFENNDRDLYIELIDSAKPSSISVIYNSRRNISHKFVKPPAIYMKNGDVTYNSNGIPVDLSDIHSYIWGPGTGTELSGKTSLNLREAFFEGSTADFISQQIKSAENFYINHDELDENMLDLRQLKLTFNNKSVLEFSPRNMSRLRIIDNVMLENIKNKLKGIAVLERVHKAVSRFEIDVDNPPDEGMVVPNIGDEVFENGFDQDGLTTVYIFRYLRKNKESVDSFTPMINKFKMTTEELISTGQDYEMTFSPFRTIDEEGDY